MKIAILTNALYNSLPEYVAITDVMKCMYCGRHGIEYVRMAANPHPELHAVWQKPRLMLDIMRNHDWTVWVDCDAAPINMVFDLEKYLSSVGDHVVMMKDIMGFNAGVFAVPGTDRGVKWMTYIESIRNEKRYQTGFREQNAIADSFGMDEWRDFVVEPPREIGWNNYLELYGKRGDPNLVVRGSWMLHIPCCDDVNRGNIFRNFMKALIDLNEKSKRKNVYTFDYHSQIGDNVVLTGAIHNVKLVHPEYTFIARPSKFDDIYRNNSDFVMGETGGDVMNLGLIGYGGIEHEHTAEYGNLVEAATRDLCLKIGIDMVPIQTRVPVVVLTDEEIEESRKWNGKWLVNANCQNCSLRKGYPHWQEVIDGLNLDFVQIGGNENRDFSVDLKGVTDMRGKTTLRDLIVMAMGCDGIISSSSAITNIGAAFCKDQIVLNASGEPDKTTDYPNAVHVSHKCSCGFGVDTGCCMFGIRECDYMISDASGRRWCKCQMETSPEKVIFAVSIIVNKKTTNLMGNDHGIQA